MKIKLLTALTICIVTAMPSSSRCGSCDHQYKSATCTTPQICVHCDKTQGEALGHNWISAAYELSSTCTRCGETIDERHAPIREWGFFDLEAIGNALIPIDGYSVSENGLREDYVIIDDSTNAIKIENGYIYEWDFTIKEAACVFENPSNPSMYTITNNDNIIFEDGWNHISIEERETCARENFVVFISEKGLYSEEEWYIPYSLIDWEKPVGNREIDGEWRKVLYLIPSIIDYDYYGE